MSAPAALAESADGLRGGRVGGHHLAEDVADRLDGIAFLGAAGGLGLGPAAAGQEGVDLGDDGLEFGALGHQLELEQGGGADEAAGVLGFHAGQVGHDAVVAGEGDDGFADAVLIDAVPDDLQGPVHHVLAGLLIELLLLHLDDDMGAAGQIQSQVDGLGGHVGMLPLVHLPLTLLEGEMGLVRLAVDHDGREKADAAQQHDYDEYGGPKPCVPFHEALVSFISNRATHPDRRHSRGKIVKKADGI